MQVSVKKPIPKDHPNGGSNAQFNQPIFLATAQFVDNVRLRFETPKIFHA